jgi:hypothetical protein
MGDHGNRTMRIETTWMTLDSGYFGHLPAIKPGQWTDDFPHKTPNF